MSDAFLPSTVRFTNRVINWLRTKPRLYDSVLRLAKWHDRAMDFRKYGKFAPGTISIPIAVYNCRQRVEYGAFRVL